MTWPRDTIITCAGTCSVGTAEHGNGARSALCRTCRAHAVTYTQVCRVWVNRVHDGDRATFLAVTASPGPCRVFQALNRTGPRRGRTRCGPGSGPDVHRGDRGIEFEETMKTQAAWEAVHAWA